MTSIADAPHPNEAPFFGNIGQSFMERGIVTTNVSTRAFVIGQFVSRVGWNHYCLPSLMLSSKFIKEDLS
jgi:hypothetical protein